jgi:murein DD-endopeptidase MepM/ murein hydrolase activator NlpD
MKLFYPLSQVKITQYFGERPEVYKPLLGHNGLDFKTMYFDSLDGKRPIFAAADGLVSERGDQGTQGYGKFIRLRHIDGSETIYGHLHEHTVQKNEQVAAGQVIAISDNTGFSNAPHLHFGYRPPNYKQNNGYGGYIDPLPFLEGVLSEQSAPLISEPLTLLKKKNEPAIYIFGHDNLWHGLATMEILKTLKGSFDSNQTIIAEKLPGNIGSTIGNLNSI